MVSFSPTEDQELIRQTAAAFGRDVLRPAAREADEKSALPQTVVDQAWALGIVQSGIPEEFGGAGEARSVVTSALLLEELAYGDLGGALHMLTPRLFTLPIATLGTPEQRSHWLGRFVGEQFVVASAAVVEPRWDFDLGHPSTIAERDGDHWVITGAKCWVPLADRAEALLVYARAPEGVAAFIVEKGLAGLTVGPREKNMGLRAFDTFPLTLDRVRVSAGARLGGPTRTVETLADAARVATAALAVGVARAALDYAVSYAKDRRAFGQAIGQKQAIAFKLADMAIEIDAIRLLTWEAAWRLDQGLPATREAVLARQYAAERALKITDDAVQVLGGHGYIREHPVELWLRNARAFATMDGLALA